MAAARTWLALVALLTAAAVATLVVQARASTEPQQAAAVVSPLDGVPQQGPWLGRKDAKLVLVEYVDMQCPYCARFSREVFPTVVRRYVKTGRVRVLFRGLAFVGPDSLTGLRWVVAAGRQNRLWNMVEVLFANQGRENSGWLTTARLSSFARTVGLQPVALRRASTQQPVTREIRAAAQAAQTADVPGTPYFEVGRTLRSLGALRLTSFEPADFSAQLDARLR